MASGETVVMNATQLQQVTLHQQPNRQRDVAQSLHATFGQNFQNTYDQSKPKRAGSLDISTDGRNFSPAAPKFSAVKPVTQAEGGLGVNWFTALSDTMVRIQHALLRSKHQAVETHITQMANPLSNGGILA